VDAAGGNRYRVLLDAAQALAGGLPESSADSTDKLYDTPDISQTNISYRQNHFLS
jgi:hypothetical protein